MHTNENNRTVKPVDAVQRAEAYERAVLKITVFDREDVIATSDLEYSLYESRKFIRPR